MKRINCATTSAMTLHESDPGSDRVAACLSIIKQLIPHRPDLIVLPEACDWDTRVPLTEHLDQPPVAEQRLLLALQTAARTENVWIAFGAFRPRKNRGHFNSSFLLDPSGTQTYVYDKSYLTEQELKTGVVPGAGAQVFATELGRVAPVICFELNFTEARDRVAAQKPDLILFHSLFHGGLQQQAWAYACRCHFVSAVGGLPSGMLSPTGRVLATTPGCTDTVMCSLDLDCCLAHLDNNREKITALKQKYGPDVAIHDPGGLGSVEVVSLHNNYSARQMAAEFGIELLDDYLIRLTHSRNQALFQLRSSRDGKRRLE